MISPNNLLSFLKNLQSTPLKGSMQVAELHLPEVKNVPNISFKPVSTNVYAGYDAKSNTQFITIKKGAKLEVRIYRIKMRDGSEKEIKLLISTK